MQQGKGGVIVNDRYHIAEGVFYLLSTLICTPEVFLSVAREYWLYIFRPLNTAHAPFPRPRPNSTSEQMATTAHFSVFTNFSDRSNEFDNPFHRTMLQVSFGSAFSFAGHFSNLLALILVTLYSTRCPQPHSRIRKALFVNLFLQMVNLVVTIFNTDRVQTVMFVYSLANTILMHGATALIVVGLFELVIKFPTFYAASLLSGQPICMMISAGLHMALVAPKLHPKITGAIYFSAAVLISLAATVVFLRVTKTKYFIYRVQEQPGEEKGIKSSNIWRVLWKARWFYATLFFLQGTTYAVHPGFTALIVPLNFRTRRATTWENRYFVHAVTFFGYSFCNMVGRELAKKVAYWNIKSIASKVNTGMLLMGGALARFLFVPMLLFCNAQTRKHLPVYFDDNAYIAIISLFAFFEGILINLTILKIFLFVEDDERREAFVLIPFVIALASTICTSLNLVLIRLI